MELFHRFHLIQNTLYFKWHKCHAQSFIHRLHLKDKKLMKIDLSLWAEQQCNMTFFMFLLDLKCINFTLTLTPYMIVMRDKKYGFQSKINRSINLVLFQGWLRRRQVMMKLYSWCHFFTQPVRSLCSIKCKLQLLLHYFTLMNF